MAKDIKDLLMKKLNGYDLKMPSEAFEMMLLIVSESDRNPRKEDDYIENPVDDREERFYSSVSTKEETMKCLPEEFSKEVFYEWIKKILEHTKKEAEVIESGNNIFYVKSEKIVIAVFIAEKYKHCKEILWFVFLELSKCNLKRNDITNLYTNIRNNEVGSLCETWFFKRKYVDYIVNTYNLPDVELLISLSSCLYEGAQNKSILFIAGESSDSYGEIVEEFGGNDDTRKLISDNRRTIRKLMEIAGKGEVQLLATSKGKDLVVTHLVKCSEDNRNDLSFVEFKGFLHWSIFVEGREMLSFYQGDYHVNLDEKDEERREIQTIKEKESDIDADMLADLVKVLEKQKHGTSAILIKDKDFAKEEVERLCNVGRGMFLSQGKHYEGQWDEITMLVLAS